MLAYDERQSGMDIPLEPGRKVRLSSRLVGFDSPLLGERERHGWFRRWSTWAQEGPLERRRLTACMYKIVVKSQLHRRSR